MVLLYSLNAVRYDWWEKITLIIWGDTTNLVANDPEIQELVKEAIDSGILVRACKKCVEDLEHLEKFESLGVDVVYIGQELTDYIKNDRYSLLSL